VLRTRPLRFASLALAAAGFAAGMVASPPEASADRHRIRGGGGVHVRGQGRVRVGGRYNGPRYHGRAYGRGYRRPYGRPYYRPYYRPRVHLRYYARPYFFPYYYGYRYAAPPPCYYECGPSYYSAPPVAVAAPARAPQPELPRLGIGIFGGTVGVENDDDYGGDLGLVGRLRLTRHFMLEAEVSKTELSDGERVDKRIGGALMLDLLPHSALSPFLLGGGGFGQTDVNDGTFTAEQLYGELGVGLEWRLGRHFALFGDIRAGVRETNASEDEILLVRGGPGDEQVIDDNERFTRARLGALLYF
jgi:hypothetical protein